MIMNFNDHLNRESFDYFVKTIDSFLMNRQEGEKLNIYFGSPGGINSIASAIIKLINDNKENIILYAYDQISSNGFKVFFEVKCEKMLIEDVIGMYHLTRIDEISIYEGGKMNNNNTYEQFARKSVSSFYYLNKVHKYVNFTKEELEDIKNHKDIFFNYNRLMEMYRYNKKYLKNE